MSFEIAPETPIEPPYVSEHLTSFMGVAEVSLDRIAARNTEILRKDKHHPIVEFEAEKDTFTIDGYSKRIEPYAARALSIMVQAPQARHSRDELEFLLVEKFSTNKNTVGSEISKSARILDQAGIGIELITRVGNHRRFTHFELYDFVFKPKGFDKVPVATVRPKYYCLSGAVIINPVIDPRSHANRNR